MMGSTALIFLTWFSFSSKMLIDMPDCLPHRRQTRLDSSVSIAFAVHGRKTLRHGVSAARRYPTLSLTRTRDARLPTLYVMSCLLVASAATCVCLCISSAPYPRMLAKARTIRGKRRSASARSVWRLSLSLSTPLFFSLPSFFFTDFYLTPISSRAINRAVRVLKKKKESLPSRSWESE